MSVHRIEDPGTARAGENIRRPVYLDYHASTPVDPAVMERMLPFFNERFGNPHSRTHAFGRDAEAAVEAAREDVAAAIGAEAREIIFTSGATESNNIALLGAARFHKQRRPHVVIAATEHKCVVECAKHLASEGHDVTFLEVAADGLIDLDQVREVVTERTAIVSVMAVNNEIGTLQPVEEIGAIAREQGALFHSDCAQAVAKVPLDVNRMQVDLLSISGHKIYGPKGVGVLYLRRRPRARLSPLFHGGGQERGVRSGTLPAALCVGIGEACRIGTLVLEEESSRVAALRDRLEAAIFEALPDTVLNGNRSVRVAGNLNVSFPGVNAERLIEAMPDLAVSTGSACTSASVEPSSVLRAIGIGDDLANASIRFGLGRYTSVAEVDYAAQTAIAAVRGLRAA